MARKEKSDYFKAFEELVGLSCDAAQKLNQVFREFNPANLETDLKEMHQIEHAADIINHRVYGALADEFITPIERDDIIELSQNLDEIIDKIEDVLLRIYMHDVGKISSHAFEMAKIVEMSTNALRVAMIDFRNFKKSQTLKALLIDVSDYEEKADDIYVAAITDLYRNHKDDPIYVFSWDHVLTYLEKCVDECSHVADRMQTIIMKNT